MTEFIQVSTTVNSKERADKIASKLLDERAASCVQVLGPIQSTYWWKGRIERAREWICFIKARADDYRRIEAFIRKIHPYDAPEILAFPVLRGNADYLNWIKRETARKPKQSAKLLDR
ncbi:MAG TPA: divalent-cation tolerance protein CutA [Candidatus Bathyarchaeia archaeon]